MSVKVNEYTKRPVTIQAVHFEEDLTNLQAREIHHWMNDCGYPWLKADPDNPSTQPGRPTLPDDGEPTQGIWLDPADGSTMIRTLEGDMKVSPGDWIIRGVDGELYPCKPDIFKKTYVRTHPHHGPDDDRPDFSAVRRRLKDASPGPWGPKQYSEIQVDPLKECDQCARPQSEDDMIQYDSDPLLNTSNQDTIHRHEVTNLHHVVDKNDNPVTGFVAPGREGVLRRADAELIIYAPDDLTALLDYVDELEQRLGIQ